MSILTVNVQNEFRLEWTYTVQSYIADQDSLKSLPDLTSHSIKRISTDDNLAHLDKVKEEEEVQLMQVRFWFTIFNY
jgi:hypothetical protein